MADGSIGPAALCSISTSHRPSSRSQETLRRWLDLIQRNYPEQADHIVAWLAHRVQRPDEKDKPRARTRRRARHRQRHDTGAGEAGDRALEFRRCLAKADASVASTAFSKSVILRVSEARDLGDFDRYAFHDHMKVYHRRATGRVARRRKKHTRVLRAKPLRRDHHDQP